MDNKGWDKVKSYLKEVSKLDYISALLDWDLKVNCPRDGVRGKDELLSYIRMIAFKKFISDQFGEILEEVELGQLSPIEKEIYENIRTNYYLQKKIPIELYERLQKLKVKGYQLWVKAKSENNFSIFSNILEDIVSVSREIASIFTTENNYDPLLQFYEPSITSSFIERINEELKQFLIPWIREFKDKERYYLPKGNYPIENQKRFILRVIEKIGFKLDKGRLDTTLHPFTTVVGPTDIRITTKYSEDDPLIAIFGAIHETGHGLFEQLKDEELYWLIGGIRFSFGLHESQSRFWENIIGRSYYFWKYFYPILKEEFPQLKEFSLKQFLFVINRVEPSLIRIEADEVTYNLHIILRFELEEALLNDKLKVKELPYEWNQKMKKYLGVEPKKDSEGVLQDVHWSQAYFGYFPSYMLGNIFSAQIYDSMKRDIKDIEDRISKGEFEEIIGWLREKVYRWGLIKTGQQLIKEVTSSLPEPKYWIDYIKEKFETLERI